MNDQNYVALAEALRSAQPTISDRAHHRYALYHWNMCVVAVADVLAADNSRFDRERFVKACQGEKS